MSSEALLEATVEIVRGRCNLDEQTCDIQVEGHPPATMGDFYVSFDEGTVVCNEKGQLKEDLSVECWITVRANVMPPDRIAVAYGPSRMGGIYQLTKWWLTDIERSVITAIHGNHDLRVLACNILGISTKAMFDVISHIGFPDDGQPDFAGRQTQPGGDGTYGDIFTWPLWYQGRGKTEPMGPEWAGAPEEEGGHFLVRHLTFAGGMRVQRLDNIR